MARIEVSDEVYDQLKWLAAVWNTTVGEALDRLVDDLSRPGTDRADGAPVAVRQEGKRNP